MDAQQPTAGDTLPLPVRIAILEQKIEDYYSSSDDDGYPDTSDLVDWQDQLNDLLSQGEQ